MSDGNWQDVAALDDIEDDEPLCIKAADCQITLCKLEGSVYALDDICTHEYASMSDGFIEGDTIECPLHQAQFSIKTGEALTAPATEDLKTYETKVEDGRVLVKFDKA